MLPAVKSLTQKPTQLETSSVFLYRPEAVFVDVTLPTKWVKRPFLLLLVSTQTLASLPKIIKQMTLFTHNREKKHYSSTNKTIP